MSIRKILERIPGLRSQIAELASAAQELNRELERKRIQREDLQHAPACREDVCAWLLGSIDAQAAEYLARFPSIVRQTAIGAAPLSEDPGSRFNLLTAYHGGSVKHPYPPALVALLREPIKAAVREFVADMAWDDSSAGPPAAERRKRIAQLDAEIEALEREHATLREEAQAVGLHVDQFAELPRRPPPPSASNL